jgi:LemA protein
MSATMVLVIFVVILAVFAFLAIGTFNRLVVRRNEYRNAFSQIEVQLNRRYDLIPNLVETAKAYMAHEAGTLENVIRARNQAHQAAQNAAKEPGEVSAMKKLSSAEGILGQSLGNFRFTMEAYPDLKADQTMTKLMEELSSTENRVAFARQFYNDSVMGYNNTREVFPSNIIAGMFNFSPAQLFEVEAPEARKPVKVSF